MRLDNPVVHTLLYLCQLVAPMQLSAKELLC